MQRAAATFDGNPRRLLQRSPQPPQYFPRPHRFRVNREAAGGAPTTSDKTSKKRKTRGEMRNLTPPPNRPATSCEVSVSGPTSSTAGRRSVIGASDSRGEQPEASQGAKNAKLRRRRLREVSPAIPLWPSWACGRRRVVSPLITPQRVFVYPRRVEVGEGGGAEWGVWARSPRRVINFQILGRRSPFGEFRLYPAGSPQRLGGSRLSLSRWG